MKIFKINYYASLVAGANRKYLTSGTLERSASSSENGGENSLSGLVVSVKGGDVSKINKIGGGAGCACNN